MMQWERETERAFDRNYSIALILVQTSKIKLKIIKIKVDKLHDLWVLDKPT